MQTMEKFHPAVIFSYFVIVIGTSFITENPIVLLFSVFFAMLYSFYGLKVKHVLKMLSSYIFIALFIVIINAVLADAGETVLFFIGSAAVSLEEIYYGLSLAFTVIAVFSWFVYLNRVFTGDKFLYLFGGIMPRTALSLSLSIRYIPAFRERAESIRDARTGLGISEKKGFLGRLWRGNRVFLGLLSWSFEQAVDTAATMRARGYGTGKRSRYSHYRFRAADGILTGGLSMFILLFGYGMYSRRFGFSYYPIIRRPDFSAVTVILYGVCGLLFSLPLIIEIKEAIKWRCLKFGI